MSRLSPLAALALLLPLSLALAAEDKKPDADGFVTIFDGKSLDGWKKSNENQDSDSAEGRARSSPTATAATCSMSATTSRSRTSISWPK